LFESAQSITQKGSFFSSGGTVYGNPIKLPVSSTRLTQLYGIINTIENTLSLSFEGS
jgi:hypothetical protein